MTKNVQILITFLVVVLLGAGTYYYFNNKTLDVPAVAGNTASSTSIATSSVGSHPVAVQSKMNSGDASTLYNFTVPMQYENQILGFSLAVPMSILIRENDVDPHRISTRYARLDFSAKTGPAYKGILLVNGFYEGDAGVGDTVVTSTTTVAGIAVEQNVVSSDGYQTKYVKLEHNGDLFFFVLAYTSDSDKIITNEILRSLHF